MHTEKHHILPKSTFPEFENDKWNIIELDYDSHKLVHLWIFKSINIRKYQRPLNWMMNHYKNQEETSNSARLGWIKLKNDPEKYKKWSENRSKYMSKLSISEQSRRSKIFWNNISDIEYLEFCNKIKNYWTEDRKKEKSKDMKDFYSNPKNVDKKREESKKIWDNKDDESRNKFREKMSLINKDENKRLDAGNKIKELWKDPVYLNKMKNRKKNMGEKIKLIKTDGDEIIFKNMKDMIDKCNFSAYLIRKYRDTNKKISKNNLKEDNIYMLGGIIETVKNLK
jgi:hypothetical protein